VTAMASVRDLLDGARRDLDPTPAGWANPMHYRAADADRARRQETAA
jgi:hypothetical protein